jgi:hypothetical protein
MGGSRWDDKTWTTYSDTHIKGKTVDKIYTRSTIKEELNPLDIKIRESRDSSVNPNSNAIIVALDVSGSMDPVLDTMAKKGLPTLFDEIYSRKPVTDPHIMLMGVGDVEAGDRYPLQVTQFEADIKIAEQLKDIVFERGGGGNHHESYNLPWYFAGLYTSIDCFEKRSKKGYLFTVGDEEAPEGLKTHHLQKIFRDCPVKDMSLEEMLALATRMYNVYHIIIEEGNYASIHKERVFNSWVNILGQNVIRLSDHTKMAEAIITAIQLNEGENKEEVLKSWDGSTSVVMARAFGDNDVQTSNTNTGIVTFS